MPARVFVRCCPCQKSRLLSEQAEARASRQNQEYFEFMKSINKTRIETDGGGVVGAGARPSSICLGHHTDDDGLEGFALALARKHSNNRDNWHNVMEEFYNTQHDFRHGEWRKYNQEEFSILRLNIARGTTCKLHLVQHRQSKFVAVMKILNSRRAKEAKVEFHIHTIGRDSPFLLRAVAAFKNEANFYILMEYAPFKTLDHLTQAIKGIGCEFSRTYALEIACGLHFLHSHNIIHRDVKPENMMILASGHVVLGDFGSAFELKGVSAASSAICGTYVTRPPEVWHQMSYDTSVDIWMFGISLYNIITNKWPILHPLLEKHVALVDKGRLLFSQEFTTSAEDLITKMVQVVPAQRIDAQTIAQHCFFDGLREPFAPPYSPTELMQIFGNHEDIDLITS